MEIIVETLDDALRALYPKLLQQPDQVSVSRSKALGNTRELIGALIEITKPRARLSRTETRGRSFSCLGELLWYLSRNNSLDFIRYYIPKYAEESRDGRTVFGGYGPRLFNARGNDQIKNVIDLLRRNPNTRRAVVQIFSAEDISEPKIEIPCTTTLQFILRDNRLNMLTTMRSNDAYMGLPHDVFCFTMLQEIVARSVDADLGSYYHFVGSMHLYDVHETDALQYLGEAVQPRVEMPEMPQGDPWPAINRLLIAEDKIRFAEEVDAAEVYAEAYWADLVRLLQIFAAEGNDSCVEELRQKMASNSYDAYIEFRKGRPPRLAPKPAEPRLRPL
jgi:thymidylate synthase